jgi:hypothetical protein
LSLNCEFYFIFFGGELSFYTFAFDETSAFGGCTGLFIGITLASSFAQESF